MVITGAGEVAVGAAANSVAVPENTLVVLAAGSEVVPEVITSANLGHKSVAEPLTEPLFDGVQAPGVRVNVDAATVPVFLIEMIVVEMAFGTSVVLPPNVLIEEQLAAFVVMLVAVSVLLHVTGLVPVVDSCIVKTPDAAVFVPFVMVAVNADKVPVIDSDSSTAPNTPAVIASGVNLPRFMILTPDISQFP